MLILGILMELFVREIKEELIDCLRTRWDIEVESFDDMFYRIILIEK